MNGDSTRRVSPKLQQSKIDIVSLECQNSHVPMDLIELIRGKTVMVGAIDVATNQIENAWSKWQIRFVRRYSLWTLINYTHQPTVAWHPCLAQWLVASSMP